MAAKRILVTGASGFVGRPLVHALVRSGYGVRAATRSPSSFPSSVDVVLVPDFTNQIDWEPILRGIDIVIHLAAHAHADAHEEGSAIFDRANTIATRELVHATARATVERFLYISSVRAQTGPSAESIVAEQDDPRPTDDYGRSKLAAELAVRAAGVPFTILRPVVIYGPYAKANFKSLVRLASTPLPLPFAGFNGRRSILGIDNFISAVLFVLNTPKAIGEVYLVADAEPVTIYHLFEMLREARGRRPWLFYIPPRLFQLAFVLVNRRRVWDRLAYDLVVDTSKLHSLGWHPPTTTLVGFRSMLSIQNQRDNE
jgi:nucleoside-diphosphate-sugar epimerase